MSNYEKKLSIYFIIIFVGVFLGATIAKSFSSHETESGIVEDKSVNFTSTILGTEISNYHVIISDKSYTTDREEWNKISVGDEVAFTENRLGEIIIENVK